MKIRSLIQLGKSKDALAEYEQLTQGLTQDDPVLLKEVGIGFAAVLVKDMREQMRGQPIQRSRMWMLPKPFHCWRTD